MPRQLSRIQDLKSDAHNVRRHSERKNIGLIADMLSRVGAARSIVIDEAGVVLAGNGVLEAAGREGIQHVKVVEADGKTLIAVRRSGLTKKQKAELAVGDNRTNELSDWDMPALTALAGEVGLELGTIGFTDEELAEMSSGPIDDPPSTPADTAAIGESFQVVIECRDEQEQQAIFNRMTDEGLRCRLLTL